MQQSYFSLPQRPFATAPSLSAYQDLEGQTSALQLIGRCIDRNEGLATLIGGPGLGKTALTLKLADQLSGKFRIARLCGGGFTARRGLLQAICQALDLPFRGLDEGDLRVQFADFLQGLREPIRGVVLIVDEADALSIRLLEELRLLTNLGLGGDRQVSLVLVGGMTLEERLASPYLASFSQRITARAYLETLTAEETSRFVTSQIQAVMGWNNPFETAALQAIHRLTGGVPRVINQLCDHCLILAGLGEIRKISEPMIAEAWADLQRLPAPVHAADPASGSQDDLIEFGGLDDLPGAFPQTVKFREAAEQDAADDPTTAEANETEPEIELVFQNAKDPFEEPFEAEEVVIDKFASLGEEIARSPWLRVDSPQSSEIAAILLSDNFDLDSNLPPRHVDIVLPEYPPTDELLGRIAEVSLAGEEFAADDRDMIEIDHRPVAATLSDQGPWSEAPSVPIETARPRNYRQLFSRLRREHA